jgi:esterase/lipase superfamily enzyme
VGEGDDIQMLQKLGVTVIDLTQIDTGQSTKHSAFASSPELISVIQQRSKALSSLQDADSEVDPSPLNLLQKFTNGLVFPPLTEK